jgi:predicted transcriptional regulator
MRTRADKPASYFAKLLETSEEEIDYSDIPATTPADWKDAEVLLPVTAAEFGEITQFIRSKRKRNPRGPQPAVPVDKSITPDYLVCLEDGRKLKMLKRHLRSTYNMTPDEYRAKWGLAPEYPMVAPKYAEQRSAYARRIGFGRRSDRGKK